MKYINYFFCQFLSKFFLMLHYITYYWQKILFIVFLICIFYFYSVNQNNYVLSYIKDLQQQERITNKVLDSLDRVDSIRLAEKKRDSLLKIELKGNCNW